MTLPKWDDEMKFELLRLKSELRPDNFRVLHNPIGLGRIAKSDEAQAVEALHPNLLASARAPASLHIPDALRQTRANEPQSSIESRLAAVPSLPPLPTKSGSPLGRSLTKIFLIHLLDVAFVLMTLGLGLLLATWLIDPGHVPPNTDLLKQATPMRFLFESNLLFLVLGLYGFFSLYWLFFKLVSGSTLGESFLDNFWSLQNPRRTASVKDSRDS